MARGAPPQQSLDTVHQYSIAVRWHDYYPMVSMFKISGPIIEELRIQEFGN
jgi:hypothetical protein